MQIKETLGLTNKALEGRERTGAAGRGGKAVTASGAKAEAEAQDRVELSGRSREMAKAAEVLAATPEVREQRVAELRRRIDNHEYQVDADQVAHRMIVNFLREII